MRSFNAVLICFFLSYSPQLKAIDNNQDGDCSFNPKLDMRLCPCENFISSSNVMLRPLFPDDYMDLCPIFTNSDTMRYFGSGQVMTIEQVKDRTLDQSIRNNIKESLTYHWALITHGGIAGRGSIVHPHNEEKASEIIYCISPKFGGRGLTTEASRLLIDSTDSSFIATAHPKNFASIAVLTKLGFKRDLSRQNVKKFGSVRDYFLLEKE